MDWINQLTDDLLLQILSRVSIDDVVKATSLVSKKWHSLSSLVSKLDYNDHSYCTDDSSYKSFTQFVYRTLLSSKAPVLDKLKLNLGPKCQAIDISIWIETAISHRVRELFVMIRSRSSVSLPRSLFTCKTLETLTLHNCSIVPDVNCCLPSLKTMYLFDVAYASLLTILPGCPNLEVLDVTRGHEEKAEHKGEDIIVAVPWLKTLIMERWTSKGDVCVIKAPSLEYLVIIDDVVYVSRQMEYMPNLVEAYLHITQEVTYEFLRALASARRLYLCVSLVSKVPSTIIFFSRLVHLEICTRAQSWWDLLCQMLQNSPKLASLKLDDDDKLESPVEDTKDCSKWPSSIPESLESFEWSGYRGRQKDLEMATYLIENAAGLKTAMFSPHSNKVEAKYGMLKELTTTIFSPRSNDVDPNCGMQLKELVAAIFSPLSFNVEAEYRMLKESVAESTPRLLFD